MPVVFKCDHCHAEKEALLVQGHMVKPHKWYMRQHLDKIMVACSKTCANTIDSTRPKLLPPDMSKLNG